MFDFVNNLLATVSNSGTSTGADIIEPIILVVLILLWFVFMLFIYLFTALCLMLIAKKTNTADAWWAWIPFLNLALMCRIANRPLWWVLLFFIPVINVVINIFLWMEIAQARGKPNWVGILFLIPFGPFIVPGYLAFSS